MKLLFGSFWRAVAYCLHPQVLMLSLLPLLVAGVVTLGVGYLYWESALSRACARRWSTGRWSTRCSSGSRSMLGAGFRTGIAGADRHRAGHPGGGRVHAGAGGPVDHAGHRHAGVARGASRTLERRHGGSWWLGVLASFGWTIAALLMVMITLPFWLVPGLALVLPPLIWGWLTAHIMGFDALAEHASRAEREAILRAHRWPLLVMGIVCGFLCGVPSMIWTLGMG